MKKIIFLILVLVSIIISCEKQDTIENKGNTDYFPNSTGSYWKYERYDSLSSTIDTLTVLISGDTLISDIPFKIWNYMYNDGLENLYVRQSNDSVIFFNIYLDRTYQLYMIPFEPGNGWINPDYPYDTSYVSKIEDIVIDGKVYQDVAVIKRTAFCCNDYLIEKIWIKPQFGLLKLERNHFILGPYKNETWKLIETTLNKNENIK